MISSSYYFQVHQQCSQWRCFSQTALQWFKVLPGCWSALPGLWLAHACLSQAFPGAPRFVASAPRCSTGYGWRSQSCCQFSQVLPGVPEGHCIGPVNSRIWHPWDSGPTTLRHSQRLLVNNIHFADDGHGAPHACNATAIFEEYTAAGWVQWVMKLDNQTLFCFSYCGQQTDGTSGAQSPMHAGRSYLRLDGILLPPAEDMINDITEELDDDRKTRRPNPTSFLMMKTDFLMFQRKLQTRIIRQQWYLEVIRNHALCLFPDYEQRFVAHEDVYSLGPHDHNMNPPTMGSLSNRIRPISCKAAN